MRQYFLILALFLMNCSSHQNVAIEMAAPLPVTKANLTGVWEDIAQPGTRLEFRGDTLRVSYLAIAELPAKDEKHLFELVKDTVKYSSLDGCLLNDHYYTILKLSSDTLSVRYIYNVPSTATLEKYKRIKE